MAAYIIFTEDITDPEAIEAYAADAVPSVLQYGGIPRIASGATDVLEGAWHGQQTVMIEFESVDAAQAWYNSPEYQAVIGRRHAAATSNVAIFEQFAMPGA
ncbi:MAG: DUF1330 domain-containing protein [Actinomycetota bacterium]